MVPGQHTNLWFITSANPYEHTTCIRCWCMEIHRPAFVLWHQIYFPHAVRFGCEEQSSFQYTPGMCVCQVRNELRSWSVCTLPYYVVVIESDTQSSIMNFGGEYLSYTCIRYAIDTNLSYSTQTPDIWWQIVFEQCHWQRQRRWSYLVFGCAIVEQSARPKGIAHAQKHKQKLKLAETKIIPFNVLYSPLSDTSD